jgi:hypothetical protein
MESVFTADFLPDSDRVGADLSAKGRYILRILIGWNTDSRTRWSATPAAPTNLRAPQILRLTAIG